MKDVNLIWRAWKENQIYEPETIQSPMIPKDFVSQSQQKNIDTSNRSTFFCSVTEFFCKSMLLFLP